MVLLSQKQQNWKTILRVEEAKKRDHNIIGRQLGYFTTVDYIGQGLPILLPNGARVIQQLARFVEDERRTSRIFVNKNSIPLQKVTFTKFPVTGTITVTVCLYWEKRKRAKKHLRCVQ